LDLLVEKGFHMAAWHEAVELFLMNGWDSALYTRAQGVARRVEPAMMEHWRRDLPMPLSQINRPEFVRFAAPLAISCEQLGEFTDAQRYLQLAMNQGPQAEA
jgi:hypothetical protein